MLIRKVSITRQNIVLITICLLCVALKITQSASPNQTGAQQNQQQIKQGRQPPAVQAVKRAKAAAKGRSSQDAGSASKFQARMMRSDLTSAQSLETPEGSPLDGSQNSDMWQANGPLTPTFTDQEQGDEMVALASELGEPEQVAAPPSNLDSSRPRSTYSARNQNHSFGDKSPIRDQASVEGRQVKVAPSSSRSAPNLDEYYNDEEEDDDEPSKMNEFDSVEPKGRSTSNRHRFNQQADHFVEYQTLPAATSTERESSSYRVEGPEQVIGNQSAPGKLQAPALSASQLDGGWQPKGLSIQANHEANPKLDHQQRITQQGVSKHPSTAKRLATLLSGGRDSLGAFSRTDVAIEYLRNILKNKQQNFLTNNYTSVETNGKQQFDSSITDKNISLQRLSSFTSKLNQFFNTTSPEVSVKSGFGGTSTKAEQSASKLEPKKASNPKASDLATQSDLTEPKTFLSQQADTKFSIVDAKPPVNSIHQADNNSPPTTKLPFSGNKLPSDPYYLNSQQPQDISLIGGSPNGTPLGGDYIESQDEFPRGGMARSPQQDSLVSTLVGAESQQNSQKAPQETRFPEQLIINHSGPSNLRQPFRDSPISTTYFQMHQLPAQSASPAGDITPEASHGAPKISTKDTITPYHQQQFKSGAQVVAFKSQQASNQTLRDEDRKKQILALQTEPPVTIQQQQQQQQHQIYPTQQVAKLERPGDQQVTPSPSKLYKNLNEHTKSASVLPINQANQAIYMQSERKQQLANDEASSLPLKQIKPPKIVSYNYFESPSETGQNEFTETNYQLGDALYSSNGGMEQLLSGAELEAIQNQFMTLEHPLVPIGGAEQQINGQIQREQSHHQQHQQQPNYQAQDANLAGLLANLKPNFMTPEALQKLSSPERQAEEALKELASQEQPTSLPVPPSFDQMTSTIGRNQAAFKKLSPTDQLVESGRNQQSAAKILNGEQADSRKKKSLIVYLNHPRPVDMSAKSSPSQHNNDGHNLAHLIGEQQNDSTFISAKEFDSHGLSKDTKHLDVSNLQGLGLGEIKENQDKDGLSVVVIGDAYKYKKIVLLISSKSGGLKFIPMVKDMKK